MLRSRISLFCILLFIHDTFSVNQRNANFCWSFISFVILLRRDSRQFQNDHDITMSYDHAHITDYIYLNILNNRKEREGHSNITTKQLKEKVSSAVLYESDFCSCQCCYVYWNIFVQDKR